MKTSFCLAGCLVVALFSLLLTPSDAAVFTVTSANDSGPGTLRQAIQDANLSPEADSIHFDLPGDRVHTLAPLTPLPEITNSVHIDGYTQPGSRANTLETGSDAVLCVRLDGIYITNGLPSALVLRTSNSSIRGLVIVRFAYGIQIDAGSGNVIAGNWIGLDVDNMARGMTFEGIRVTCPTFGTAIQNVIGGSAPADRNLISGNRSGVSFSPTTAAWNTVIGNYIGTDASGRLPRGNVFDCINIQSATNIIIRQNILAACTGAGGAGIKALGGSGHVIQGNRIGLGATGEDLGHSGNGISLQGVAKVLIGGDGAARNLVGGNRGHGVSLLGCSGVTLLGNRIGTGALGSESLGNLQHGIWLSGSSSNHIGGEESLNTIAFNGKAGVCIVTGTANRIVSNSIFNNATLGIDLGDNGANTNDVADLDDGPNELQNRPVLTKAYLDAGTLRASAILESTPNTTFTLQFFASRTWDPLWIAEGQDPLGNASVTTDAAGLASVDFSVTAPAWALEEAVLVTATATDPVGNTSEFSDAAPLLPATPAPRLSIRQPGVVPVVSWPAAAEEYQLQTAPSLAPGAAWEPITSGIVDEGSEKSYPVLNLEENPNRFFRLKK